MSRNSFWGVEKAKLAALARFSMKLLLVCLVIVMLHVLSAPPEKTMDMADYVLAISVETYIAFVPVLTICLFWLLPLVISGPTLSRRLVGLVLPMGLVAALPIVMLSWLGDGHRWGAFLAIYGVGWLFVLLMEWRRYRDDPDKPVLSAKDRFG